MTLPKTQLNKRLLKLWIQKNDVKKWIIATETGNGGYKHYQVRMDNRESFDRLKTWFPQAHIEKSSDNYEYECKEGYYIRSEDTNAIRMCRFSQLRPNQRRIIRRVKEQNDRTVTVVCDDRGGTGKSFLSRHLFEKRTAFYCPPTISSVQGIIQFICSGYHGEEIIIIDIPRSWKWSKELYTVCEAVKDGLVYDQRYSCKMRDIYGVKLLVMTNSVPTLDRLSADRWDLIGADGLPLS